MIAPTAIQPPKNWQDFETLCLKLWGEIWEIPHEIEFNSDNSQGQQGVDIYGPIMDGLKYNGIQCKNKKLNLIDGSRNRITVADVQAEIDKALEFQPALNKLVIATSLPKDQKVEEYVRLKSADHIGKNLFSLQICFWEFFERKIPEFSKVYDWYLKNENYYRPSGISIAFAEGDSVLEVNPKFRKKITTHIYSHMADIMNKAENTPAVFRQPMIIAALERYEDWEQYCWFDLFIRNSGKKVIENYKIELDFEGDFEMVGTEAPTVFTYQSFKSNVKAYSNCNRSLYIEPYESVLVPSDGFTTSGIYIQPKIGLQSHVKIKWTILSRDFEDSGELVVSIVPKYNIKHVTNYVQDRRAEGEIVEIELIRRKRHPGLFSSFSDDISAMEFE